MRFPSSILALAAPWVLVLLGTGPAHAQGRFYYGYSGPGYYQSWPDYTWSPGYWSSPYRTYYSYPYSAWYYSPSFYPSPTYTLGTVCPPSATYPPSRTTLRPVPQARAEAPVTVVMSDDHFEPTSIQVLPGTTVRWINSGQHVHTVTADNESFRSGDIAPGGSYSMTFVQPGRYSYHCRYHAEAGMRGAVVVGRPDSPGGSGTGARAAQTGGGY